MEQWIVNNQFQVLMGTEKYGFLKISNLVQELEYESIEEGGRNWSPVFFRKAKSKRDILSLERGVRTVRTKLVDSRIRTGTLLKGVIIIIRMDNRSYRKYTFDEGVVIKLELSGLNAMGNEILIEKMEIAHSGLYEIKV